MLQLIEENSITDPTYVEDFLLTHRTFIDSPLLVAGQLLEWFEQAPVRDRVARVVLLWVNNHFTDFETDPAMMEFLEAFEAGLEREKMQGQQRYVLIFQRSLWISLRGLSSIEFIMRATRLSLFNWDFQIIEYRMCSESENAECNVSQTKQG